MPTRSINIKSFIKDIHAGMDLEGLMVKYCLNERDLDRLCRKLNDPGVTKLLELINLRRLSDSQEMRALSEIKVALDKDE